MQGHGSTARPSQAARRLCWFQHFHKAGGSSVVALAQQNGERLYPGHANGSPLSPTGHPLPLERYDASALSRFVDHCLDEGVTFVASEWGCPDLKTLAARRDVVLVTCLRDPLERLVSNYIYDTLHRYERTMPISAYYPSPFIAFRQADYCVRMLCEGVGVRATGPLALQGAKDALGLIDVCAILEADDPFAPIARALGWRISKAHVNRRRGPGVRFLQALRRKNPLAVWAALWLYGVYRMRDLEAFKQRFVAENAGDIALYAHAGALLKIPRQERSAA